VYYIYTSIIEIHGDFCFSKRGSSDSVSFTTILFGFNHAVLGSVSKSIINLIRFDGRMHNTSTIHVHMRYCRQLGQLSTIHLLGKRPCAQISSWANGFLGKCLTGQCPSGQLSSGQMSFWANVFLGKCISGQMSYRQMSYGQTSLGKCLWANVVSANVVSPYMQTIQGVPEVLDRFQEAISQ
jgi:hypothetical protein